MTCKQKLHTRCISVPHSCCRCSLKLGHRLCQGQHSKGWYLKYHREETTNFSSQHTLLFLSSFSPTCQLCCHSGHPCIDQYSLELAAGIQTTPSGYAFSSHWGLLLRHVLRCGSPIWQPNGWVFALWVQLHTLPTPPLSTEERICISEVLGTSQGSTY